MKIHFNLLAEKNTPEMRLKKKTHLKRLGEMGVVEMREKKELTDQTKRHSLNVTGHRLF